MSCSPTHLYLKMSKHLALSDGADAILINGFDDLQKLFDDGGIKRVIDH